MSLNTCSNNSINKGNEIANDHIKSISTLSNSHSSQSKGNNKYKRCKSSSKIMVNQNNNSNYLLPSQTENIFFELNDNDSSKIVYLKKSFEKRISSILYNLKGCLNKININNYKEVLNEDLFLEKEKVILDLYEQNSIIKNEYEENKTEMDRLQKVISVLEIDINKYENEIKELNLKNQKLNEEISRFQLENFQLNLKLKSSNNPNENNNINNTNNTNNINKINNNDDTFNHYNTEINNFQDKINNLSKLNQELNYNIINQKNEYENKLNLLQKSNEEFINKINAEYKIKNDELLSIMNQKNNEFQNIKIMISQYQIENEKLKNNCKYQNQTLILFKAKLNEIKNQMNFLIKDIKDILINYKYDFKSFSEIVINKIKYFKEENNEQIKYEVVNNYESNLLHLQKKVERLSKENKLINENKQNYFEEVKKLTNKNNTLEIENQTLKISIQKLKRQIEQDKYGKCISNKNNNSNIDELKNKIKDKIQNLKNKYFNQILVIKSQLNDLLISWKEGNESLDKSNYILQLEQKIKELNYNEEEHLKLLNKKSKKIKELEKTLNQSFHSASLGMKNIKIANKLDDEVKELIKKSKE